METTSPKVETVPELLMLMRVLGPHSRKLVSAVPCIVGGTRAVGC